MKGGTAPLFLNLGARLRRVVNYSPVTAGKELIQEGPQSRSGRFGEEKNVLQPLIRIFGFKTGEITGGVEKNTQRGALCCVLLTGCHSGD
jgi:hypothetical protein